MKTWWKHSWRWLFLRSSWFWINMSCGHFERKGGNISCYCFCFCTNTIKRYTYICYLVSELKAAAPLRGCSFIFLEYVKMFSFRLAFPPNLLNLATLICKHRELHADYVGIYRNSTFLRSIAKYCNTMKPSYCSMTGANGLFTNHTSVLQRPHLLSMTGTILISHTLTSV